MPIAGVAPMANPSGFLEARPYDDVCGERQGRRAPIAGGDLRAARPFA